MSKDVSVTSDNVVLDHHKLLRLVCGRASTNKRC